MATAERPINFIVSPANSHGLMDGGIDLVYCRMFPGIDKKVREAIHEEYPDTHLLPIGRCLVVPITNMRRHNPPCVKAMISFLTMVVPSDIRDTDNIYQAMRGLLTFLKRHQKKGIILRVVIPGLGTTTGRVPFDESARQILQALNE